MRTYLAIFLLTVGCMGESNGSAAEAPLAATQTRNSRIRHSSRTGAPQHPLSLPSPANGLQKRAVLRASGESLMGPCEGRACTLRCGFLTVALGA
jgi:hypothetical protein